MTVLQISRIFKEKVYSFQTSKWLAVKNSIFFDFLQNVQNVQIVDYDRNISKEVLKSTSKK